MYSNSNTCSGHLSSPAPMAALAGRLQAPELSSAAPVASATHLPCIHPRPNGFRSLLPQVRFSSFTAFVGATPPHPHNSNGPFAGNPWRRRPAASASQAGTNRVALPGATQDQISRHRTCSAPGIPTSLARTAIPRRYFTRDEHCELPAVRTSMPPIAAFSTYTGLQCRTAPADALPDQSTRRKLHGPHPKRCSSPLHGYYSVFFPSVHREETLDVSRGRLARCSRIPTTFHRILGTFRDGFPVPNPFLSLSVALADTPQGPTTPGRHKC
jgi:hypothetical protein